jgi:hypothetical protein
VGLAESWTVCIFPRCSSKFGHICVGDKDFCQDSAHDGLPMSKMLASVSSSPTKALLQEEEEGFVPILLQDSLWYLVNLIDWHTNDTAWVAQPQPPGSPPPSSPVTVVPLCAR